MYIQKLKLKNYIIKLEQRHGEYICLCQDQADTVILVGSASTKRKKVSYFREQKTNIVMNIQLSVQLSDRREKVFNFNRIFEENTSKQQLYDELDLSELVTKVLDGYHSTIFAYGQTGSGKTYTIQGPEQQNSGIIYRALDEIFEQLSQRNNNDRIYKVMLSFVQIYNEGIYDLIDATGKPLRMRWNKHQQFIVENLFEVQCRNKDDALKWWRKGQKNKIMGSHKMNINSSRSHCLFTLKVSSYDLEDPSDLIQSKFQIVDLAGSERQKVTKSTGAVFREGIEINKSLFTLRQVIAALYEISQGQNSNKHIPYRDSKLTSLLKQSIGGNTYCTMIACLNPTSAHFQESLQTLTYASMASFINNVPSKNVDPKIRENQQLREQNQQYRRQIKKMAEHIQELTKMLQAGVCASCKNNEGGRFLRRTQTENDLGQDDQSEPTGILKLPRFENRNSYTTESHQRVIHPQTSKLNGNEKNNNNGNNSLKTIAVQKKTLKTNKDILQSITMIKELINANSGLREKIEILKELNQKQEKEIFDLMKENQVLRDRWDMLNDAIVPNQNYKQKEAPIATYERLLQEQKGLSGASFYKSRGMAQQYASNKEQRNQDSSRQQNFSRQRQRQTTQNSQSHIRSSKPTSYNQFLKMTVKQEDRRSRRKKNLSMYHSGSGKTDYLPNH